MKIRMKIRSKLLLSVLFISIITYGISVGYLVYKLRTISLRDAHELADAYVRENANLIRTSLNSDMDITRAMAQSMKDFRSIPERKRVETFNRIMHGIAVENPNFLSVWVSWEVNALDSSYKKDYGRYRFTYYRENGVLKYKQDTLNLDGDAIGGGYHNIKVSKQETMMDPYWFSYTETSEQLLEASTAVPIIENGVFRGLFGLDIELSRYQIIGNQINPLEGSYAIMLSNNSTIVSFPDYEQLGKPFENIFPKENEIHNINERVKAGENFSFLFTDSTTNIEYYATFASISIGKTENPWSLGIVTPTEVLLTEAKSISKNSLIISIIGLVVLAFIILIIAISITRPLLKVKSILGELAKGNIKKDNKLEVNTGDEIEEISNSMNTLIDGLSKTVNFANEIGKGHLEVNYETLSESDMLGKSLLEMRKSLQFANEQEELRRKEDEKINWATSGMAKFAEILRQNNDNMTEFSYQLISNLVKYIDANVGAMFLLNDEKKNDIHFELVASYAYERRKFIEKRVEIGEGLIGRCAQERETIYMTEIPSDYIQIASGLGDDAPSCLLIVPLKLNENVHGVIELASFNVFEKHIIDFVEKIGESVAATVSTVKINIKTVKLLEESRIKSEELSSQEEEMRQNMEELQATQEEAARKTAEMESLIKALHASSFVIEYDPKGIITSVNDAYLALTNQSAEQIIGTHHSDNLMMNEKQLKEYNLFWDNLRNGIIKKETSRVTMGNKVFTFIETYSPIFNENHEVIKILKIAHDISEFANVNEEEAIDAERDKENGNKK